MNFKIDLGLNEKRVRVGDIDLAAAAEDMAYAESALNTCETERAIVVAAAENLERGLELSKAIAEKTQDEGVALAVGKEALTASLRMLGQASAASQITAGTESYTAGAEAAEGMLSKMMDKVQEYGKKIWYFITNLVAKVVKFVKGIFGKGDATGTQLEEKLKKAEDEGRTTLKVNEFDTSTARRIVSNVKYLAKKQGSKGIDKDAIIKQITEVRNLLNDATDRPSLDMLDGKLLSEFKDAVVADDNTTLASIKDKIVTSFGKLGITIFDAKAEIKYHDDIKDDADMFKPEIDSNATRVNVFPLANDGNVLSVLAIYLTVQESDMTEFAAGTKTGKEALDLLKKVFDGVHVKTINLEASAKDIEGFIENTKPLSPSDVSAVIKELLTTDKSVEKVTQKLEKIVDGYKKAHRKAIGELKKESKDATGVKANAIGTLNAIYAVYDKVTQAVTKNATKNIKIGARNKLGDIIIESIKLYEK